MTRRKIQAARSAAPRPLHMNETLRRYTKRCGEACVRRIAGCFRDVFVGSSIPGMRYVVNSQLHVVERVLWALLLAAAAATAILLVIRSQLRYSRDATVLAIETDYLHWVVDAPAFSFCVAERVNSTRAELLVRSLWHDLPEEKVDLYKRFIIALGNISLTSLTIFSQFENETELYSLTPEKQEDIAWKVQTVIHPEVMATLYDKSVSLPILPTLTETGFCYAVGSQLAPKLTPRGVSNNATWKTPKCHHLNNRVCQIRLLMPQPVLTTEHSTQEVGAVDASWRRPDLFREERWRFLALQQVASGRVEALPKSQRACSRKRWTLCPARCRRDAALRTCGCAPFFYRTLKDQDTLCSLSGLVCLSREWSKSESESLGNKCRCLPPCSFTNYQVLDVKTQFMGPRTQPMVRKYWTIDTYAKLRIKKRVIYTFEDLLVSYGATAAFFLGCSVLSLVELPFLTLRCLILGSRTLPTASTQSSLLRPSKHHWRFTLPRPTQAFRQQSLLFGWRQ